MAQTIAVVAEDELLKVHPMKRRRSFEKYLEPRCCVQTNLGSVVCRGLPVFCDCRFYKASRRVCSRRIEDLVRRLGSSDRVRIAREDRKGTVLIAGKSWLNGCCKTAARMSYFSDWSYAAANIAAWPPIECPAMPTPAVRLIGNSTTVFMKSIALYASL